MRRWLVGDTLLTLREHETVFADEALIAAAPGEVWEDVGLSVRRLINDPTGVWRVTAGQHVGMARLHRVGLAAQLQILPKLDADLFFLADYAYGATRDLVAANHLDAELEVLRSDPAACLLAWYLAELESFAVRWLRRDYLLRTETFEGRVRGRLLVGEYARRHVARGEPQRVPCQFFELTHDSPANQVLMAALRHVSRLTRQVPLHAARQALRRQVARVQPYLAGVSATTIRPADFNRLRLRGAMQHYRPIIDKSAALLRGSFLSADPGRHRQDAFLWDANRLFQDAVAGALASWPGGSLVKRRPKAMVRAPDGSPLATTKVDPDYVIGTGGATLLLDAKWKDAGAVGGQDDADVAVGPSRIRVGRPDVYQAVSYGRHDDLRPAVVGLIYPIVLGEGESLPEPYTVAGFGELVNILFMDVGYHAGTHLSAFFDQLDALVVAAAEFAL